MADYDLCGLSPEADALIVNEETGGQAYYEKTELHPDYPGGASGVTIGNGYDCGYSTAGDIATDWGPYLPADAVAALASIAGIHGSPAQSHAVALHWITVPWDAAQAVYHLRDIPKWVATCRRNLPNFDKLNGDCKGVEVSIAFNRGASFDLPGDRYREMRAIKAHMIAGQFDLIPAEIRSMKRLWPLGTPDHADLTARREHEAVLFEQGLAAMAAGATTVNDEPSPAPLAAAAPALTGMKWVQDSLNRLGASPILDVDGDAGPETKAAIRAFRLDHNLPDIDQVDDQLCAALDAAIAAKGATA